MQTLRPDRPFDGQQFAIDRFARRRRLSLGRFVELAKFIGIVEQVIPQVRTVQAEQLVQQFLAIVHFSGLQIRLQEIDARARVVPLGIVDGLHDVENFGDVAVVAQVTRDHHQHVGLIGGQLQHVRVVLSGVGEVPFFQGAARQPQLRPPASLQIGRAAHRLPQALLAVFLLLQAAIPQEPVVLVGIARQCQP
ncbi:MAG: hypothetical protein IH973_08510 [Myxococcales bacterium]|nr:hypothetical protein [Myxococcales bacterium]